MQAFASINKRHSQIWFKNSRLALHSNGDGNGLRRERTNFFQNRALPPCIEQILNTFQVSDIGPSSLAWDFGGTGTVLTESSHPIGRVIDINTPFLTVTVKSQV